MAAYPRFRANDSSPPAKGKLGAFLRVCFRARFIPSCEGQTGIVPGAVAVSMIHPFLRRADVNSLSRSVLINRFIPSYEGQTIAWRRFSPICAIHPFLRRADTDLPHSVTPTTDSSPPTRGRRGQDGVWHRGYRFIPSCEGQTSVFMRLLAALNTSLYNLHKCHSRFIHIFNMPKNPPHFHFF